MDTYSSIVVGATPSTSNSSYWKNGTISWLPSGVCQDCEVIPNDRKIKMITLEAYKSCSTTMMNPNTILIALTGATVGKVAILKFHACANQSVVGIEPFLNSNSYFVFYQLMARRDEILSDCIGSAQPHISKEYVTKMYFALPPIEEQQRIINKINFLESFIEQYAKVENELFDLDSGLESKLKKSILQYAIKGKLVKQDPNDEPASVLLERIKKEKDKLIKEGKIKKDKTESTIYQGDDKDYYENLEIDLPQNWKFIKLGNILQIARGGSPRPIQDYLTEDKDGYNWIKISDAIEGSKYIYTTKQRIKKTGLHKTRYVVEGDFLLTNSMSFGHPYILKTSGCIHDGWLVLRDQFGAFNKDFLYYLLMSPYAYKQFCEKVTGAVVKNLNIEKVENSIFGLPPLNEQRKIASNVEKLFYLIENC